MTLPETIREKHLNTEASIRSLGILYYLAAIFVSFQAVTLITLPDKSQQQLAMTALMVGIVGLNVATGVGLRRLRRWAQIAAGIMSAISMMNFPIGTIIGALILFVLFSPKGRFVFTAEYKQVIAATPHMKYRTAKWVWIALVVFLLLMVLLAVTAFAQGRR